MTRSDDTPWSAPVKVAALRADETREVRLEPAAAVRQAVAAFLGIEAVRKLRLAGRLAPLGADGWELTATLGATVVQACVVSGAPVTTRIDEPVARRYLRDLPDFEPMSETEMPEDDSVEALGAVIDPGAVMVEALALALPLYPHAPGVAPGDVSLAAPGTAPLTDEDLSPFAALKALRDKGETGSG